MSGSRNRSMESEAAGKTASGQPRMPQDFLSLQRSINGVSAGTSSAYKVVQSLENIIANKKQ